jgi:phage FluMu protein Com
MPRAHGDECRCHCGALLARLVPGSVELRCRRCKRVRTIPLANASPPTVTERSRRDPAQPRQSLERDLLT